MSRVLVLSYLIDPIAPLQVKTLEAAAPSLGVKLHVQTRPVRWIVGYPPGGSWPVCWEHHCGVRSKAAA